MLQCSGRRLGRPLVEGTDRINLFSDGVPQDLMEGLTGQSFRVNSTPADALSLRYLVEMM